MKPQASIIIPACNEENYIQRTLESIYQNRVKEIEVIVVLDSCTDKTNQVVGKFRQVKMLRVNARKPGVAKNTGAKHSTTKNLIFLDADTTISKNAIGDILRQLKKNRFGSLKVKPHPNKAFARWLMYFKNLAFAFHLYPGSNGLIYCTRTLFDRLGGFDERLGRYEDGDFTHKAARIARYTFITSSFAKTSIRRFEKLGYFYVMTYWVRVWWRHLTGKRDGELYEIVR
ncbi:MAG: glycosyltransferase [Candidatus Woesearchaeota archaeon]